MENQKIRDQVMQYNSLYKEMDDIYHSLANHYGLSDTALWLLYILRESEDVFTQSRICEKLSLSKQTINSALKNLEKTGYVTLKPTAGNQKNKQVQLTDAGKALAQRTVDHVLAMEQSAFRQFSARERLLFLQLNQKYVIQLQKEAAGLLQAAKPGGV